MDNMNKRMKSVVKTTLFMAAVASMLVGCGMLIFRTSYSATAVLLIVSGGIVSRVLRAPRRRSPELTDLQRRRVFTVEVVATSIGVILGLGCLYFLNPHTNIWFYFGAATVLLIFLVSLSYVRIFRRG